MIQNNDKKPKDKNNQENEQDSQNIEVKQLLKAAEIIKKVKSTTLNFTMDEEEKKKTNDN